MDKTHVERMVLAHGEDEIDVVATLNVERPLKQPAERECAVTVGFGELVGKPLQIVTTDESERVTAEPAPKPVEEPFVGTPTEHFVHDTPAQSGVCEGIRAFREVLEQEAFERVRTGERNACERIVSTATGPTGRRTRSARIEVRRRLKLWHSK